MARLLLILLFLIVALFILFVFREREIAGTPIESFDVPVEIIPPVIVPDGKG